MAMREGEHLLAHRVPDHCHEAQTGSGSGRGGAVLGVVAVVVLLVLMLPQRLHVLDWQLGGGVRGGQAGQLAVRLRQRLDTV